MKRLLDHSLGFVVLFIRVQVTLWTESRACSQICSDEEMMSASVTCNAFTALQGVARVFFPIAGCYDVN